VTYRLDRTTYLLALLVDAMRWPETTQQRIEP
jgi:hypothetical protein